MKLDNASKARLAKAYAFAQWSKPASPVALRASVLLTAPVSGYVPQSSHRHLTADSTVLLHILWSANGGVQPVISTQVFEAKTASKAADLLLYLLGQFEGPPLKRARAGIGDVAFATSGHRLVVFQRQNLAIVASNIQDKPGDLSSFAGSLSAALGPVESKPSKTARGSRQKK
jgi:hypothetical protein